MELNPNGNVKSYLEVIEHELHMKKNYTNEEILSIQRELDEKKVQHELDGVEITSEDAITVLNIMSNGLSKDDAIDEVLNDICDVLS